MFLATPCCDTGSPRAVNTKSGAVRLWDIQPNDNYSKVEVLVTEGGQEYVYTYAHLQTPPEASAELQYEMGEPISAGTLIARFAMPSLAATIICTIVWPGCLPAVTRRIKERPRIRSK